MSTPPTFAHLLPNHSGVCKMNVEPYNVQISVNADEYRVYWYVTVEDHEDNLVEHRSFTNPEDAEEFADLYR